MTEQSSQASAPKCAPIRGTEVGVTNCGRNVGLLVSLDAATPGAGGPQFGLLSIYATTDTLAGLGRRAVATLRARAARHLAEQLLRAADAAERVDDGATLGEALAGAGVASAPPRPRLSTSHATPTTRAREADLAVRPRGAAPPGFEAMQGTGKERA